VAHAAGRQLLQKAGNPLSFLFPRLQLRDFDQVTNPLIGFFGLLRIGEQDPR
jgi:hypothetical protein